MMRSMSSLLVFVAVSSVPLVAKAQRIEFPDLSVNQPRIENVPAGAAGTVYIYYAFNCQTGNYEYSYGYDAVTTCAVDTGELPSLGQTRLNTIVYDTAVPQYDILENVDFGAGAGSDNYQARLLPSSWLQRFGSSAVQYYAIGLSVPLPASAFGNGEAGFDNGFQAPTACGGTVPWGGEVVDPTFPFYDSYFSESIVNGNQTIETELWSHTWFVRLHIICEY